MIGFIFAVAPTVFLFTQYDTSFSTEHTRIPNWFFFYFAFSYFMYRMFDEMDGKQARRTKTSTALGMMMDHGFDSFSVGFIKMVLAKSVSSGDSLQSLFFVAGSCMVFHFTILEEYYIGGMFMGPFNAITDMSFVMYGFFSYLGFFNNDQLQKTFEFVISIGLVGLKSRFITKIPFILF